MATSFSFKEGEGGNYPRGEVWKGLMNPYPQRIGLVSCFRLPRAGACSPQENIGPK